MKKILSIILSLSMLFSIISPVAASAIFLQTSDNISGTIVFQQESPAALVHSNGLNVYSRVMVTVSYIRNNDGSYTIFQYNDGQIMEEHTTTPGSGIVYHKFYNADGSTSENAEVVQENINAGISPLVNNDPYSELSSGATTRQLGHMHYRNSLTGDISSAYCYLIEEAHINQSYTFYKDTAKTLSSWVSTLLSVWAFFANPVSLAKEVVDGLLACGVLSGFATGLIYAAVTRTVHCTYYNNEIHGYPSQGSGSRARLDGTYCYLDINSSDIMREGYIGQDWGTSAMGRRMMYEVFGIDAPPTSWADTSMLTCNPI